MIRLSFYVMCFAIAVDRILALEHFDT